MSKSQYQELPKLKPGCDGCEQFQPQSNSQTGHSGQFYNGCLLLYFVGQDITGRTLPRIPHWMVLCLCNGGKEGSHLCCHYWHGFGPKMSSQPYSVGVSMLFPSPFNSLILSGMVLFLLYSLAGCTKRQFFLLHNKDRIESLILLQMIPASPRYKLLSLRLVSS